MSQDNTIIEFPRCKQAPVTLGKVVEAMDDWRANKKIPQEPIPEAIWQQIFALLEQKIPQTRIQAATGITRRQLCHKLMERSKLDASNKQSISPSPAIDFCEAKAASSNPAWTQSGPAGAN